MAELNRRNFLHLLGAAGFTPVVSSLPIQAASTGSTMSSSKALWASIYAKSDSKAEFISFTRSLGLSNTAIQGVSARSIGVKVTASSIAQPIPQTTMPNHTRPSSNGLKRVRAKMKDTLEKYFTDEDHKAMTAVEHEIVGGKRKERPKTEHPEKPIEQEE